MNKQTTKIHKAAPLPFQGQKRNFVSSFIAALKEFRECHEIDTVVDLFGGSGLLSHVSKRLYPDLKVVYNDFDNFHVRIKNAHVTNSILESIRTILRHSPRNQRLTNELKTKVLNVIKERENEGSYIDYITLSSSLLFSANYVLNFDKLSKENFYNNVKQSSYEVSNYLDGLDIVSKDYKYLYDQYKGKKNVLFIIDPPYLSTDTSTYSSDKYWKLKDYLDVLNILEDSNYVYFTSDKSSIIELFEWLEINYKLRNPFNKAKVNAVYQHTGRTGRYTDLMYYKNYKR